MISILIYFFIGISLSMDAFSLAISLGTISPTKKTIIKCSLIVGIFHFFMPILGNYIGSIFSNKLLNSANFITFFIFLFLSIEMFLNRESEEKWKILNTITIILIAFTVSIDSFTVGIAFGLNKENTILASTLFSIVSATFTLVGLFLGRKLSTKNQKQATYIGIILMLLVALKYLLNL